MINDFMMGGIIKELALIQILRFVAAALVVVNHAHIRTGEAWGQDGPRWLEQLGVAGASGVHIFFFISGFIMAYSTREAFGRDGAVWSFITRRFLRIFPVYWLSLIAYIIVLPLAGEWISREPLDYVCIVFLAPGCGSGIIGPGWSLTFELYFYLIFGLALLLPRVIGLLFAATVLIGGIVAGVLFDLGSGSATMALITSPLLVEFVLGIVTAQILFSKFKVPFSRPVFVAGWLLLLTSPTLIKAGIPEVAAYGGPSFMIVWGAVFMERAGHLPDWLKKQAWLGESSYGLYLIHMAALIVLAPIFVSLAPGLGFVGVTAVLSVIAITIGFAFYEWVEKPVMRLVRAKLLPPRPKAGPAQAAGYGALGSSEFVLKRLGWQKAHQKS